RRVGNDAGRRLRHRMTFLSVILKNLFQRPARSLLTVGGIVVGIGAVVAFTSLSWGFETAWVNVYTARGTDLIVTKAGSLSPVPATFTPDLVHGLTSLPRVAQSSGMLSDLISLEDAPIVLLFGWERQSFVWDHLKLVRGRWPSDDNERVVVL